MRFSYSPDTDSLYIELIPKEKHKTKGPGRQVVVSDETVVDLDSESRPVGIDLYQYASKMADLSKLEAEGPLSARRPGATCRTISRNLLHLRLDNFTNDTYAPRSEKLL